MPLLNIRVLTLCAVSRINFEIGSKAFISFIIPPNAPVHIDIATDHDPASAKPFVTRARYDDIDGIVPAIKPNNKAENNPTKRHGSVEIPYTAIPMTRISGTIIYIGTPFLTCSKRATAEGRLVFRTSHISGGIADTAFVASDGVFESPMALDIK